MNKYDTVIGLEVHVQLSTVSKIFCSCSTNFENPANTNICPVCCGYPGVLPVFNKRALELAVRVGLALHCRINPRIYFERKNYFYPDLPKNYQISQYKMPLGEEGYLEIPSGKKIKITRVHLEEDAGKLVHKENHSLVDFNRTGTPLLEIVTEPDIDDPAQAHEYLTYLKLTLQYIGASDCDMERGLLRCDANVSLKPAGATRLGTKVELKNMNTFRGVRDALAYEVTRQAEVLESRGTINQETRLWNAQTGKSEIMRTKEDSHDYRYFPEPDLLDFIVESALIEGERSLIGELPLARRQRFMADWGLAESEVDTLVSQNELANFFEAS
ncbi:MAG: Asp-tRNA(Asn)/Glu-tRNA(Gln) amidotransferase subunit GatB, partial [Candidatus Omnitrophota bacterium]